MHSIPAPLLLPIVGLTAHKANAGSSSTWIEMRLTKTSARGPLAVRLAVGIEPELVGSTLDQAVAPLFGSIV